MIYIDFAKAYDSVEFWGLQQVLEAYGFDRTTCKIIQDITEGFHMKIKTEHGMTENIQVERGCPQGSPISPTLFALFLLSLN